MLLFKKKNLMNKWNEKMRNFSRFGNSLSIYRILFQNDCDVIRVRKISFIHLFCFIVLYLFILFFFKIGKTLFYLQQK